MPPIEIYLAESNIHIRPETQEKKHAKREVNPVNNHFLVTEWLFFSKFDIYF